MLIRRSRMIPLTGERIVVYPRLTVASSRSALATASVALTDGQRGLGRLVVRQGRVVFLGGDDGRPSGLELATPLQLAVGLPELGLGLLDVCLGLGDAAARLVESRLEQRTVEPGQHGPLFDPRAVADRLARVARVGAEALDPAGHLGAHVDDLFGLDRPGCVDRGTDVASFDGDGTIRHALGAGIGPVPDSVGARAPEQNHQQKKLLHDSIPF